MRMEAFLHTNKHSTCSHQYLMSHSEPLEGYHHLLWVALGSITVCSVDVIELTIHLLVAAVN